MQSLMQNFNRTAGYSAAFMSQLFLCKLCPSVLCHSNNNSLNVTHALVLALEFKLEG